MIIFSSMGPFGCLETERFSHLLGEISWYYGLRIQWQDSMPHTVFSSTGNPQGGML